MLIKKEDIEKKQNYDSCIVWQYETNNKNLSFATSKINGRYPEKGKSLNKECNMLYFVIFGKGIIHHESGDFEIKEGDAFFFEKGKFYWVEGENLFISISTSPSWFLEQYIQLD